MRSVLVRALSLAVVLAPPVVAAAEPGAAPTEPTTDPRSDATAGPRIAVDRAAAIDVPAERGAVEPELAACESGCARPISAPRRALAITLAIVPGVVVRGAGSWVVDDRPTARRLAWTAAIGVGAMLLGGLPVGITGGNPYLIVPGVPLALGGAGLFVTSWLSDIWRASGGGRVASAPRARAPWAVELGTTYTRDALRQRALLLLGAQLAVGRVGLHARGYLDAGGDAAAAALDARIRLRGAPAHGAPVADGSRVELRVGAGARTDRADRVDVATTEVEAIGRLDLRRLGRVLDAAFVELSTGLGLERVRYAAGATDVGTLLLGGFAWGAYLGRRGEATLFYDHRRDQLAGGIAAGRAAGFVGSVGASVELRVVGPWAARAELEFGSAWVGTVALQLRGGAR